MSAKRRTLIVIALNNLFLTLGFRLWQSLFNNFAVEELGVKAGQIGWIQSVREIPGFLGFLVGLLALLLTELRIAGLSVLVMGAGIYLTASSNSLAGLIATTLLMSTGFHFFSASNSSAVLLTVGTEEAPKVLGQLNSLAALASVVGTLLIFGTLETWGYRTLFRVAGLLVAVVGLMLLPFGRQERRRRQERRSTPLRRRYWLYYLLQFLMGSRRHIFTTFATFLLVKDFLVTAQVITLLFLLNSLIGTYFHQAFGRIVARFGERPVLLVNFFLLALVFSGYAVIPMIGALQQPHISLPALTIGEWTWMPASAATPALLILLGLFIVDHVLFGFSIALQSYLQKIALVPEDITANVSVGQTINHIAAVFIPIVGGIIWETLGGQYTFLIGVVIVIPSLGLAWRLPRKAPVAVPVAAAGE